MDKHVDKHFDEVASAVKLDRLKREYDEVKFDTVKPIIGTMAAVNAASSFPFRAFLGHLLNTSDETVRDLLVGRRGFYGTREDDEAAVLYYVDLMATRSAVELSTVPEDVANVAVILLERSGN
jgi:hypothetical protein